MTISLDKFNNILDNLSNDVVKAYINKKSIVIDDSLINVAMQEWFCDHNRNNWSKYTKRDMARTLQATLKHLGIDCEIEKQIIKFE